MNKYILGALLLAVIALGIGCGASDADEKEIPMEETEEIAELCRQLEGTWIEHANECEYIGEQECEALGGIFDDCASPCRHDPDAEMCIAVCVPVCYFE